MRKLVSQEAILSLEKDAKTFLLDFRKKQKMGF